MDGKTIRLRMDRVRLTVSHLVSLTNDLHLATALLELATATVHAVAQLQDAVAALSLAGRFDPADMPRLLDDDQQLRERCNELLHVAAEADKERTVLLRQGSISKGLGQKIQMVNVPSVVQVAFKIENLAHSLTTMALAVGGTVSPKGSTTNLSALAAGSPPLLPPAAAAAENATALMMPTAERATAAAPSTSIEILSHMAPGGAQNLFKHIAYLVNTIAQFVTTVKAGMKDHYSSSAAAVVSAIGRILGYAEVCLRSSNVANAAELEAAMTEVVDCTFVFAQAYFALSALMPPASSQNGAIATARDAGTAVKSLALLLQQDGLGSEEIMLKELPSGIPSFVNNKIY